jgi:hypothetical protein
LNKFHWLAVGLLSAPLTAAHADGAELPDALQIFGNAAELARSTQPEWISPLITTTALLEQRFRFDFARQRSGNGNRTTVLDGGRGLDLLISETNEIQIGLPPYESRSFPGNSTRVDGFADWPFVRLEQRLASAPEEDGDYVLTTWIQFQAPSGVAHLTTHAWIFVPTIAFGKGWGDLIVQGTISAVLPASQTATLGQQLQSNIALQYHLFTLLWPEVEANWTWYAAGLRSGLNQLYLTTGVVVGRFRVSDRLRVNVGAGYQFAVAPAYRARPLTPGHANAWLLSTRFNF